jgi:hypothetical protein
MQRNKTIDTVSLKFEDFVAQLATAMKEQAL